MNRVTPLAEYNIQYLKTITKIIIIMFIFSFFKIQQCIIRPIVSYVTISYLLCITKKETCSAQHLLKGGHIVKLP